jgi:hypothetical protein
MVWVMASFLCFCIEGGGKVWRPNPCLFIFAGNEGQSVQDCPILFLERNVMGHHLALWLVPNAFPMQDEVETAIAQIAVSARRDTRPRIEETEVTLGLCRQDFSCAVALPAPFPHVADGAHVLWIILHVAEIFAAALALPAFFGDSKGSQQSRILRIRSGLEPGPGAESFP